MLLSQHKHSQKAEKNSLNFSMQGQNNGRNLRRFQREMAQMAMYASGVSGEETIKL